MTYRSKVLRPRAARGRTAGEVDVGVAPPASKSSRIAAAENHSAPSCGLPRFEKGGLRTW
jgi:hypothetical protein